MRKCKSAAQYVHRTLVAINWSRGEIIPIQEITRLANQAAAPHGDKVTRGQASAAMGKLRDRGIVMSEGDHFNMQWMLVGSLEDIRRLHHHKGKPGTTRPGRVGTPRPRAGNGAVGSLIVEQPALALIEPNPPAPPPSANPQEDQYRAKFEDYIRGMPEDVKDMARAQRSKGGVVRGIVGHVWGAHLTIIKEMEELYQLGVKAGREEAAAAAPAEPDYDAMPIGNAAALASRLQARVNLHIMQTLGLESADGRVVVMAPPRETRQ